MVGTHTNILRFSNSNVCVSIRKQIWVCVCHFGGVFQLLIFRLLYWQAPVSCEFVASYAHRCRCESCLNQRSSCCSSLFQLFLFVCFFDGKNKKRQARKNKKSNSRAEGGIEPLGVLIPHGFEVRAPEPLKIIHPFLTCAFLHILKNHIVAIALWNLNCFILIFTVKTVKIKPHSFI